MRNSSKKSKHRKNAAKVAQISVSPVKKFKVRRNMGILAVALGVVYLACSSYYNNPYPREQSFRGRWNRVIANSVRKIYPPRRKEIAQSIDGRAADLSLDQILFEKNENPKTFLTNYGLAKVLKPTDVDRFLYREIKASKRKYILINIPSYDLAVVSNHIMKYEYKVRVGQLRWSKWYGLLKTPVGVGYVMAKRKRPIFRKRDGTLVTQYTRKADGQVVHIDYDKMRALALKINGKVRYSIHGTTETNTIGTAASLGCVGLTIDDMLKLFPKIKRKTPVLIVYDTIVYDPETTNLIVYPDIYKAGKTTVLEMVSELRKHGFTRSRIDKTTLSNFIVEQKAGSFHADNFYADPRRVYASK